MKILEQLKVAIDSMGSSHAAYVMARTGASMCNKNIDSASFLAISSGLDLDNFELIKQCLSITKEDDYSNADQDEFLNWLNEKGWPVSKWEEKSSPNRA